MDRDVRDREELSRACQAEKQQEQVQKIQTLHTAFRNMAGICIGRN